MKSEEKWHSLIENVPDIVMVVDRDGTIQFINHTVSGMTAKQVIGKKLYDYILPEYHNITRKYLGQVFQTGAGGDYELLGAGSDGTTAWYWSRIGPVKHQGRVVAASIITRDITEHKKAEEEIKRLSSAVEQSIDGIAMGDLEPKLLYVNRAFAEMHGYRREEMIGMKVDNLHNEQQIDEFKKAIEQIKTKGSWVGEIYHIRKDGTAFPTYMSVTLLKDDKGEPNAILAAARDVTEHKKAEEALKESEQRFRYIFDNAADGIVLANVESGKFHNCNKMFCRMLGYRLEEVKNLGIEDIHPKDDMARIKDLFERQARGEFTLARDIPVKRKDGSIFYADINSIPIILAGKNYLMGIFRDITERREAEETLRQSEAKYRTLLENLPQKIFLKDKNSVYISCNENYARDLKIKPEEIAGRTDYDDYPAELAEKYRADDKKIIESGETQDIEETYLQDGQERIIHTVKSPIKDKHGNVTGILGIFWDITELKQTKEELDMYREKMARAEQLASLGTLSATMAHELTQPLTVANLSIENSLAELEKTSCPGDVVKELKDCLAELSHITSTVNRFRNFARKSSEKTIKQVNLKSLAERITKLLNESAQRTKLGLHLKNMDNLPPLYSNEKDLEQLFFALIDNAIQAADGKKGRQLTISGAVQDTDVELQFSDNCCGIAPENIDRIFEPFFTTRPAGEGTGLGLCIVQRIVSRAGGKVRVESKIGEGSTFSVTLPINPS